MKLTPEELDLIIKYLAQLKDEVENSEKYDEPGDMPSHYLWEDIKKAGLEDMVPDILIEKKLIVKWDSRHFI